MDLENISTGELITIRNYIEEIVIPDFREDLFFSKYRGEEKLRIEENVEKFKRTMKEIDEEVMGRFQCKD